MWLELNDSAVRCSALCTSGVSLGSILLTGCATQSARNSPHAASARSLTLGFDVVLHLATNLSSLSPSPQRAQQYSRPRGQSRLFAD